MHIEQLNCISNQASVVIKDWSIEVHQHWAVFNTGQGTDLLASVLSGDTVPTSGSIQGLPNKVAWVSLAQQQILLEKEIANDDSDFLDRIDKGSLVKDLILEMNPNGKIDEILNLLDLNYLCERGFRTLSTGETRRVMLARALITQPQLLILDEPFAGLDQAHHIALLALLKQLSTQLQLIIITSRQEDLPLWITHIALFTNGMLNTTLTQEQWLNHPVISQLKAQSKHRSDDIVAFIRDNQHISHLPDPLVKLTNGKVEYTDQLIFKNVDWEIKHGQHWQVRGPNGCGKSTLLGLIFGDHPQCYSNDISIFGMQRGTGETIWDIKQHIGLVSSALHLQYRVNCTALEVIISGYYDSIGMYGKPTKAQIIQAQQWLSLLHMSESEQVSFRTLEYGQQRLLLIARALIKKPQLLILDEPYQGLDFINRQLVFNALEFIASENLTQLLYVSHHQEDTLPSIHHFVDFIGDPKMGYQVVISNK